MYVALDTCARMCISLYACMYMFVRISSWTHVVRSPNIVGSRQFKAEAPASSVTAHQRAMVLQKGVEATREELGGVLGLSEQNSARHVEKVVSKFSLRPHIPLSHHTLMVGSENFTLPYLAPKDVLSHLLNYHAELLLGGHATSEPAAGRGLALFWGRYRDVHPSHAVFGLLLNACAGQYH